MPRLLKIALLLLVMGTLIGDPSAAQIKTDQPIVSPAVCFQEKDGVVAVEAEHFFRQTLSNVRAWHVHSTIGTANISPDGDPPHLVNASGNAYLEILPDTRRTHDDRLITGENFSNEPGKMAIVDYNVNFDQPGRYYVWVRAYSTGTEDNGIHVGLDGEWPESGRRLQWTQKKKWFWDSKQRTAKVHTGVLGKIFLDIKKPGKHVISFSMREDGFEFDKWLMTRQQGMKRPSGVGPSPKLHAGQLPKPFPLPELKPASSTKTQIARAMPRMPDGNGEVTISGETRTWHTIDLTLDGPFARETDSAPNPFLDYRLTVKWAHEASGTKFVVPGYFAADGNSAETSANAGTSWRAHFTPPLAGEWKYQVELAKGKNIAIEPDKKGERVQFKPTQAGTIQVKASDKSGRDLRGKGRLQYVGKRYLQFAGNKQFFLKAGADAPETLLGYRDFDGTIARKKNVPLKEYRPHLQDWKKGDPSWKNGKGKGLIGAINYLSATGCNAFSFLTYNAGGDGDNVWPFIERNKKLHYDCSKLDQWEIVFAHGTRKGMYLHFKMQETENDDNRHRGKDSVPTALDGGDLGIERKLYIRELVARFSHHLALNWNLGEENTQSIQQQQDMANFIRLLDPYDNLIVVHTYPDQQKKIYPYLMGGKSVLRGASLQNSHIRDTHHQTLYWVNESAKSGVPWIIAFDESGSAAHGQCPDLGYRGFDGRDQTGKMIYTQHEVRRQTLWGTFMAGGAGVEYYFGYQFAENDLLCEDWRSRDASWKDCHTLLRFFHDEKIPFWEMKNGNGLIGNDKNSNERYCLALPGTCYVCYLSKGGELKLDLAMNKGSYNGYWFNPRSGKKHSVTQFDLQSGTASFGSPPMDVNEDWVFVLKKR